MLDVRVGSYRITEHLAKGGMGEVYLARHEMMDREAAVKLLHADLSDKRNLVDRFLNEARAAASIRHPGIVEIFDVGHVEGRAYIVMEYLRGELLAARLARTRIDLDRALLFTRQIAGALGAAHACGIIHRDLKPENIFIIPDPDVVGGERTKILDFGIAKLLESQSVVHTAKGALFGTPAYMAPEQCQDAGQVDRRADLYSLGCILFELLSGTPPFGRGGMELIAAHLRDQPPPLRELAPRVSAALESIVMGLLAKDPDQRFQTCEALIRALDHVQAGELAPPASMLAATGLHGIATSLPAGVTLDAATPVPGGPVAVASPTLPEDAMHAGAGREPPPASSAATPVSAAAPAVVEPGVPEAGARAADALSEKAPAAPAARPRWRGLVALALFVLGVGGFWLWRASLAAVPVPVVVVVDAGPDARALLDQARRALEDRAWDDVHGLVRDALALAGDDPELRAQGEALREQASEERTNQHAFLLFERALAQPDIPLAAKHYRELSARSVYRVDASALIDRARPAWQASQVELAEQYASKGQCRRITELKVEIAEVADVMAPDVELITQLHDKCREQRRDDDARQKPAVPDGKLSSPLDKRLQWQISRCAKQHGVHGDVVVRIQVSENARVEAITIEPAREPFVGCVRGRVPRRLTVSPGWYRTTAKIP